jgi:hypothetical protein
LSSAQVVFWHNLHVILNVNCFSVLSKSVLSHLCAEDISNWFEETKDDDMQEQGIVLFQVYRVHPNYCALSATNIYIKL